MSYSIEILEWFSRHSKRSLQIFEASLLEAEEQSQQRNPEYQAAIQHGQATKGRTIGQSNPFVASNGNRIVIYTTGKGILAFDYGSRIINTNNNNFETLLNKLLSSEDNQQQPQEQQVEPEPQPNKQIGTLNPSNLPEIDLARFVSQSLIDRLFVNLDNSIVSFESRIIDLKKLISKKYLAKSWGGEGKVPRSWKRRGRNNKSHLRFWESGNPETIRNDIIRSVVEKLTQCEVITSDGLEASPEQRAAMIEKAMEHVVKITSGKDLSEDDAYFYKENVKTMKVGGSDRVIIYSEPDENGKRVSISLPHTGEVRALFSDILVSKINDTVPDEQKITELRSVTSSEAYSAVFGTLMERIHTTFANRENAIRQVERCKDEEIRKTLQNYCDHFTRKLQELNEEIRKTAKGLLERASKITNLIAEERTLAGDSELVEALSQGMGEVSELFQRNYISEIEKIDRENAGNPEEAARQKKELIKELSKRVVLETSKYQRELNSVDGKNILEGVALTLMAGEEYKYGGRRQDVHYFSVNKENADALSAHHKTKSEVISIDDTERLIQLIPDENDRNYLIQRAKNEGSKEIYLNKKSLKNSMSDKFEIKLATDSADHFSVRNDLLISLLDEVSENGQTILSSKSEKARQAYNDFIVRTSKGASKPLTDKEFLEMLETFKSRVGKHIKNPADMKRALQESKKRSEVIRSISDRSVKVITSTQGGKEVTTSDLKNVAEMIKKEFNLDLNDEKFKELRGAISGILKKKPPDEKKLRILLQRSISAFVSDASIDKIKSGDRREADILISELYSRGMTAENTGVISYQNFHYQEAGLVAHNDLLDAPCEAINAIASGNTSGKADVWTTDTGITFRTDEGTMVMRTDFSTGKGGATFIHADHELIRSRSHTKKSFSTRGTKPTVKGSEEDED